MIDSKGQFIYPVIRLITTNPSADFSNVSISFSWFSEAGNNVFINAVAVYNGCELSKAEEGCGSLLWGSAGM